MQVLVEVESDLLFEAFFDGEDVVFHQSELSGLNIQLVDQIVPTREYLRVDDLIEFLFCMFEFVLKVEKLLVLGVE